MEFEFFVGRRILGAILMCAPLGAFVVFLYWTAPKPRWKSFLMFLGVILLIVSFAMGLILLKPGQLKLP